MSFESDMKKAIKRKVIDLQDKVQRKVALDIQADLDRITPRDTGRAASNWLGSVGSPRTETIERFNGSEPLNLAGHQTGETIYISNNLPYIKPLNNGHSKQAPAGFVEKTVQRNVNRIKETIKEVKT